MALHGLVGFADVAACRVPIAQTGSSTDGETERCHGEFEILRLVVVVAVEHQVILNGRSLGIADGDVTLLLAALIGGRGCQQMVGEVLAEVVYLLRCSRCHAAHDSMIAIVGADGAEDIPRGALVPMALHQRVDGLTVAVCPTPCIGGQPGLTSQCHHIGNALQHIAERRRKVVLVKVAIVGIAQHGRLTVVAADKNETLVVATRDDVVRRCLLRRCGSDAMHSSDALRSK